MTLPIKKRKGQPLLNKRKTSAIGLGDYIDLQWSVDMKLGSVDVPIVLDTGSSDLWSISSDCTSSSCGNITELSLIKTSEFKTVGLDYRIDYRDSSLPTSASGAILSGTARLAGLQLNNQFLGAVNATSTLPGGLTGVFGVGFHTGSNIVGALLGQDGVSTSNFTDVLNAQIADQGPFLTRLIANGQLGQPMFTITLQRDTFDLGGNIGQLTIGKLPEGVSNNSLTWVPVRLYSQEQGGIPSSSNSPNEVSCLVFFNAKRSPLFWEVPIDEVILNGQTLPKPNLNDSIGYTALINSGTSTLHGQQKTVQALYGALSTDIDNFNSSTRPSYNCTRPIELTYVIGGKQFPVDPRDIFGFQNLDPRQGDNDGCHIISVGPTNAPSTGNLRSWILGDPFMKSNLVAFYFGNVTHPSVDPPRIGFLSTVPSNASALFDAVIEVIRQKGVAGITEVPPTGTFTASVTNSVGVGQAPKSTSDSTNSSNRIEIPSLLFYLLLVMFCL
ncbi:hypothetical protein M422DRAFT_267170 [Sphaerobolus stellatus SS14]|uniref:Peptidase A1 domain-containing protein n=1 Tax=Sphaerobolus stellatus (strain SS14) TaxID=990650 RepID=A0A0C9UQ78_SPHS4|nr:hypothetical protein M422DRAFT_267170 [Sphaerobolus stellatus SS14]